MCNEDSGQMQTSVQPPLWSHGLDTHRMCLVSVPGTRHIVIITAQPLGTPGFSVLCVMTTI